MIIYGVALLAFCHLAGLLVGDALGSVLGIDANVGGVGFAMLLLVGLTSWFRKRNWMPEPSEAGILFWSAMYIPIVVSMAAIQNVVAAVSGGIIAIVAGLAATLACLALVMPIARIGGAEPALPPMEEGDR